MLVSPLVTSPPRWGGGPEEALPRPTIPGLCSFLLSPSWREKRLDHTGSSLTVLPPRSSSSEGERGGWGCMNVAALPFSRSCSLPFFGSALERESWNLANVLEDNVCAPFLGSALVALAPFAQALLLAESAFYVRGELRKFFLLSRFSPSLLLPLRFKERASAPEVFGVRRTSMSVERERKVSS